MEGSNNLGGVPQPNQDGQQTPDFFKQELERRKQQAEYENRQKGKKKKIVIIACCAVMTIVIVVIACLALSKTGGKTEVEGEGDDTEPKYDTSALIVGDTTKKKFNLFFNYLFSGTESDKTPEFSYNVYIPNAAEAYAVLYGEKMIQDTSASGRSEYIANLVEKYDNLSESIKNDGSHDIEILGYYYKYLAQSKRDYTSDIILTIKNNSSTDSIKAKIENNYTLPENGKYDDVLVEYFDNEIKANEEYINIIKEVNKLGCISGSSINEACFKKNKNSIDTSNYSELIKKTMDEEFELRKEALDALSNVLEALYGDESDE